MRKNNHTFWNSAQKHLKIGKDKEAIRKIQEHDYIILAHYVLVFFFLSYEWFTAIMHFVVCILFGMFLRAAGTFSKKEELIKNKELRGN